MPERQLYFHELVEQAARRDPRAVAVEQNTGHDKAAIDFAHLDGFANRLAQHLRALGVTAGSRVGLCLERGTASLVAQLAIFKLGAAVVLLDPEYPEARLAFMLDNAEAVALVTREELLNRISLDREFPVVLTESDEWRNAPEVNPGADVDDDTVCHVAYTSGSTGVPKAVLLRHGPLRTLIGTLVDQCGITDRTRGTWLSSPGAGLVEVDCFPVLAAGGTVCIPASDIAAKADALQQWLVAEEVTHALLLTATAERTWTLDWPAETELRNVRIAGERLRSWPPDHLPFEVVNVYGSSEATVVTTCNLSAIGRTLTADERAHRAPPVGLPVPGVRVHVLDDEFHPVPTGTPGELFVSGASLSQGYLNRPDANDEKFLSNPLDDDPNPVLYRTGDVARRWPDGIIEVVGRTDNEVKIRGYRVHLGEIESVLSQQPGVRQSAVTAYEHVEGERKLVGYVEPDRTAPPLLAAVRKALRQQLPHYMVPAVLVVVDDMPISANGKIDRAALPPPPRTRPELDVELVEPRDDLERALAAVWGDVLAMDEVGVLDNFFDLGGDSLNAIRLLSRITDELHVELGLTDLVQAPSIAQVARKVETLRAQGIAPEEFPTVRADESARYEPFPLTETQQALWIGRGSAVDFGNVGCHGYFEWERDGLDVDRFRAAWRKLVRRHDMLRAVVLPDGTQRVLPETDGEDIRVADLRDLPADEAEAHALATREEMSHQVLDSDRWPLYDIRLTLLDDEKVRLHVGIDLLIMDAWSAFQVLFPDLIELYENPPAEASTPAEAASNSDELPPLDITFRDYVLQSKAALENSDAYRRSREYWVSRVPNLPAAPDLPMVTNPRGEVKFDRRAHDVLPDEWDRLKERAKKAGVTPSGILVAAFAEVLRTWCKNDRFTINFPIFDRLPMHAEIDRLLGDFTNTLLVAVEKTDGTFAERARDIQEQMWSDLEHRHFNGVQVLRELVRQRQFAGLRPAMPIVVTSLLGHPPRRQVSALGRETYGISQTPQVLLDFQIREIDGILHLKWDFLDAMFPPGLIDAMFAAYVRLIERLIHDEAQWHVEQPELVPGADLAVRAHVNRTAAEVPSVLLHELLPSSGGPAVIAADRTLTFPELRGCATRIGRGLREAGARPNELVAIVMEKGWEQYAAVYGVLTSGAAYLPIDPAVPDERLRFLLRDGDVRFVLTQRGLREFPQDVRTFTVDDFTGFPEEELESVQSPTDLAYVIYTSGSTGRPKGVMVDHRGVVNMLSDINSRLGVGPDDRAFAISGLHFDLSVYDLFGVLAAGGCAVVPESSERPDPARWLELVRGTGVTFWNSVPALVELLVDDASPGDLDSLRTVVMAGDWIPLTLPDRLRALAPDVRVIGSGGPTETICWSVINPIGEISPEWTSIPYGRPMTNHRYHVLDQRWQDRPTWVPGQIVVGSDVGLAHGYWHDDERTREKFFRLPSTGERVYATGDLGRYLPDGSIEILGRDDFQVQVNGHRIELGEIEACAERHPDVQSCVVVAPESASGARRLVCFVVGSPEIEEFLRSQLPGYMVPADVRALDAFPLTGNGKVDRLALTSRAAQVAVSETAVACGPLEALVTGVCAEVLELPAVGVRDNFFQLGGDSLTGTRFANKLNETFDVALSVRDVFTTPTCAQLAEELARDPRIVDFAEAVADLVDEEFEGVPVAGN
ncbi:amino acid adenylation domain-containing protein [Lentzea tibetensis]|uniref:Phenyloxazoline synthase MbtB n=1 Tax=Lentzea tibetensis TaxID=2591470 RepID=A0A563F1J3_9PSEU|nr:non-ribosomal peptide synthetase [Lentzea tibetensis]TWP53789.1 amino acid adenylation domain-containing protein [Lentzea tibetensis]